MEDVRKERYKQTIQNNYDKFEDITQNDLYETMQEFLDKFDSKSKDNVLQEGDTQIVTKTVQVLEPDVLAVNKTAINVSNKYIGYDFVKCDPEVIPDSVNTGTAIKIFYE